VSDPREQIYDSLHGDVLEADALKSQYAASRVLDILSAYVAVSSVLDVGCGLGDWLKIVAARGISDFQGVEGPWLDPGRLHVDCARVQVLDLEKGFSLGRRFDLVICIEVAEHLPPDAADRFIQTLTAHSSLILFSAAIPYQGGHHHVNEQFPSYWAARFAHHKFKAFDVIRPKIWSDPQIQVWLRQNILLFADHEAIRSNKQLSAAAELSRGDSCLAVVHPDYWIARSQALNNSIRELNALLSFIRQGGRFEVERGVKGELVLSRITDTKQ